MRTIRRYGMIVLMLVAALFSGADAGERRIISPSSLKDKIAGGWAGKMIGVTYGAPVEFRAQGTTFDEPINWTPNDILGSMWQDDIYVQLTFMMTMDRFGVNAPAKKFQEMFAKAGYMLWHANVQARKNYYDSIFPPQSGEPAFNSHADDIDFQIEADYLGFMAPGMPVTASQTAQKIGHIMNYGDGVYGGIFIAALHSQAFFENDIAAVVNNALSMLPAQSDYAKMVSDVITLHRHYPDDWKSAWRELENKWGADHICEAGSTFNIDAKLNGAYIVMGLLYGNGDPQRTLEISTRCGQDADCNPSSAMAVIGVMVGFENLPREMREGVLRMKDSLFINTDYSFSKAVLNTYNYAAALIKENGGTVSDSIITIIEQKPAPVPFEDAFPNVLLDKKISVFEKGRWKTKGNWQVHNRTDWKTKLPAPQSLFSSKKGDAVEFQFSGNGIALNGNWVKDGGKADVYLDGKFDRTVDTYYFYNNQEHENMVLWQVNGLAGGKHTVRLVVKGEQRPGSLGKNIYLSQAIVFKTAPKKSASFKFSFEK
ncbi:MAG: ADP-ribosylglycohydrolase family protein [Bacteroidota bacterium]